MKSSVWVLGDQLTLLHPGLRKQDRADTSVLMIELLPRADLLPWHKQKLVLVWSAMRHFAHELHSLGYRVDYYELQPNVRVPLGSHLTKCQPDRLLLMDAVEYGRVGPLVALAKSYGVQVDLLDNDMFLSDRTQFAEWAAGRKWLQMEFFYWDMRRTTGLSMTPEGPTGGVWNLDRENRQMPPAGTGFPQVPTYEPDAVTRSVMDRVSERLPNGFGDLDGFAWPVTHKQAEQFLDDFLTQRLDCFGPHEDAMVAGERALCHSLLSPLLNIGLLEPLDVCQRAAACYADGAVRINSAEGFV